MKIFSMFKRDEKGMLGYHVVLITIIIISACIGIDMAIASYQSTARYNTAQNAVQVASRNIKADGTLASTAPTAAVNEFRRLVYANVGVNEKGTEDVAILESETCGQVEIDGVTRTLPYFEVSLDTNSRANKDLVTGEAATWSYSSKLGTPISTAVNYSPYQKYKTISMTVYSSSTNTLLGIFGNKCQLHKNYVSAIVFGSNQDLD